METTLQSLLETGRPVITDGGMGTMLFAAGLPSGTPTPLWNIENPEAVAAVHRAYIQAGAQIVLTNSFIANGRYLAHADLSGRVRELNMAAVKIARAEAAAADHPVLVAGDMGPTGGVFAKYGDMSYEAGVTIFREQAEALAEAGVTAFWVETIETIDEMRAAVEGIRQAAPGLPVVTTMSFGTRQNALRTAYGVTHQQGLDTMSACGAAALGANCGNGIDAVLAAIETMHAAQPDHILVAKANAGLPIQVDGQTVYPATPEDMAAYALRARDLGARIIGACCGSNPSHIKAIAAALAN